MFFGREQELLKLQEFTRKKSASLIVIRGRRRIGKSRLVEEFAKNYKFLHFSGVAPTERTTPKIQRDEFARQLGNNIGMPGIKGDDWSALFLLLHKETLQGRVVILLDEISWIGSKDYDFLGKLKNAWDLYFKKNEQLILIICGSASSWIDKNILSSTAFLGRISYTMSLEELSLRDAVKFWGNSKNIAVYEKLKVLSVLGGVPRYLEEINPNISAEDNIKKLCFTKGGLLVDEFDKIFSDLFLSNSKTYAKIVSILASGDMEAREICESLRIDQNGKMAEYLRELELSGFIKRDYTWDIKTSLDSKLSKYRLSDNYLRFYLKYIAKYKTKIDRNSFISKSLTSLEGFDTMLGFSFENLVLNNRKYIYEALALREEDIVSENPFFQHKTSEQPGCQIDYMIQTKFNLLYVCEIKFSKNKIGLRVVKEMKEKIVNLKIPKGFSIRPVLIHVNGVERSVVDIEVFANIIDFGEFLRF